MTQSLSRILHSIDGLNSRFGRLLAWLNLPLVLVMVVFVLLRYLFNYSPIAVSETALYLHGVLFLLGAAYTLQQDAHVRVDIFYQRLSPRGRAWVNLLGTLFLLLPVVIFIGISSWPFISASWHILERSAEAGGLPIVYLHKSLILGFVALLLLQGLAELLRNLLILLVGDTTSAEVAR